MIATADFRRAITELSEYETNPITRFRCYRAQRNGRIMDRWYARVVDMYDRQPKLVGTAATLAAFDFNDLFEWLVENWDEILKILLTILPLFI